MEIAREQIRNYRLHAHHLNQKKSIDALLDVAGACGLQNTPPGAWETAAFNRLEGCTLPLLHQALYQQKSLLQAWSYRGAPVVFPTEQSDVFLTALIPQPGEWPWIYTAGITGALDALRLSFDDLLLRTQQAAEYLDTHTVQGKQALDRTLAKIIETGLPEAKQKLWRAPSMYTDPEKQTVGEAAVSFLLRPCSFSSLVVFGQRQGISPTFTSFQNWIGHPPGKTPHAEKELVRKFLHCYGPATLNSFADWMGCAKEQAQRMWHAVFNEMESVQFDGQARFMLSNDIDLLLHVKGDAENLLLLGAHDPYLDGRDRDVILENNAFHKTVWKFSGNPGAVLQGGRIIGIWQTKTKKEQLDVSITLWEALSSLEQQKLDKCAQEYASFRQLRLTNCVIKSR